MSAKLNNIAVLIDADNASANNIGYILQEIDTLGRITCKNIYGDWGNAYIKGWQDAILKYAIDPIQKFAYVTGKNTTDIGLVIDAMDMLHSEKYDGFCLISSDSDFTALALRIRKNHVKVFGFGRRITVDAFAQSCNNFYYVEDLLPTTKAIATTESAPANNSHDEKHTKSTIKTIDQANKKSTIAWDENRLKCDTKLLKSLRASIIENPEAENEQWVAINLVSNSMKERYPSFDPKNYGYSKITSLIKKIGFFETKVVNSAFYVREKNANKLSKVPKPTTNKVPILFTTKQLQTQTHLIGVLNKLIKENPNSDEGWSNISYLASQIKQHYKNIKLDKYGYKKFSDLIAAINLYDMKQKNSALLIKPKHSHPKPLDKFYDLPHLVEAPHVQETWNNTHDVGLCMLSEAYGVALYDGYGD